MPAVVFPTRSQIRTRVRFYIAEPQQANYADSDLNQAINEAQQEIATEISLVDEKWFVDPNPTTITTVALQRAYPLATDFWKMIRLEDSISGLPIKFEDFGHANNFFAGIVPPLVSLSQSIGSASIVGNSLMFTPTPSTTGLRANYWYCPILPDLTDDSDVSIIPRMFIDLLAIQAAIDAFINDEDDTSVLERKYNRKFNQLVRASRNRQQQNPRGVTRSADDSGIIL